MNKLPEGLWPVMLTPFNDNSKGIDFDALNELVDFYINNGAAGLFVNCLSSEMFHLTKEERIALTSKTVDFVKGRIPVISTGTFSRENKANADFSKKIFDTGVDAVIVNSNQFTDESSSEDEFKSKLENYMDLTEKIPLGVYECPVPYKRLLSPELLHWMGASERFLYFKDTSCDNFHIKLKLNATASSNLGLYNANIPTAMESLKEGARGLSPIGANYFPELYAYICNNFRKAEMERNVIKVNTFLSIVDPLIHSCYPFSAKWFLNKRGLKILTSTRVEVNLPADQDIIKLKDLMIAFEEIRAVIQ
jgi:4-hydroxy-tetrahydrodipicolinate synthase